MLNRPLLPALVAYAGGILTGHFFCHNQFPIPFAAFTALISFILACIASILFLPRRMRIHVLFALFFATGVLLDLREHPSSNLSMLAETAEEVVVQGTVAEPVRITDGFSRIVLRPDAVSREGEEIDPSGKLLVQVYNHSRHFSPGDSLLFRARLRPFRNFENPGRYDYELAMLIKGFVCAASVPDGRGIVPMGKGSLGPVGKGLEAARGPLRKFLKERLDPWQGAVFRALILGETQDVGPDLRDLFTRTGLGHILAVSGLHVGLIALAVFFCIRQMLSLSYRLTLRLDIQKTAALITCIPVAGYAVLAGFHVSSQRAMVMVLAYLFSIVLGREKEIWSTFSLAALAVLAIDPHGLFTPSFHLSFGAVVGLLLLAAPIQAAVRNGIQRMGKEIETAWLVRYIIGLAVATFSATLFLSPLIAFYFHRISLVSLPANLMVLPILGIWILPLGLLSALTLAVSVPLASLFLTAGSWGLDMILMVMEFWAGFSFAEVWVIRPSVLEIVLVYGILICILHLKRGNRVKTGLALLAVVLAGDVLYWIQKTQFNTHLKVTFLDVGPGHAALVQFPGRERMLIDGGGSSREDFDIGRMVVAPCLLSLKIRRVDYLVLSHPESDHMNGLLFIAAQFKPKEFWHNGDKVNIESYRKLMEMVRNKGIIERLPSELKEQVEIGTVRIELLHPETGRDFSGRTKLNDRSMVLRLTHGGNSILFPGDLEKEGENSVISRKGSLLRSNVLLVPHHGSRSSCSDEFLSLVNPRVCIISARGGIPLRFPHPDILRRLEARGCEIFRTDKMGAISVSSSGDNIDVTTFR
ncbi:MAG: DNA internalization-related competence protein ComEC/Rec2 [Deltaproteobacteria bacterium HGW-Deltaproteobacteria-15]|jgi:competence protein ComEC|nr:MAG: DNA internalization-related competence protein ComEC/Rec2 [Deltaproteobacteria bacterium HGW-Deltaproteobacteria-15]